MTCGLVAAGCGGDEGPSREEYAQEIDEICSELEDRVEELGQASPDNPRELSRQLDELKQLVRQGLDRLDDVEKPEGEDGELAERYVEAARRETEEVGFPALDELEKAARDRDEVAARSALRKLNSTEESEDERLAEELGADECAEG